MTEESPLTLPIESFTDHGDHWQCNLTGGVELTVPKDPNNRHARAVQRYIDAGNTPANGEAGHRRRVREGLQRDPFKRAVVLELAAIQGRTRAEQVQALIDHLK